MALPAAFDPIVNAPRSQRVALGVIGLVVLLGAAYFLLIAPFSIRVQSLGSQRDSLRVEVAQNKIIIADLVRYRREAEELETRLDLLKERLPNEKETPRLYRTLSEAAIQSGLAVSLFQPRPPKEQDYYYEIPIALTAEGGYHQLGEFFERVAALPRVVTLAELKLTGLAAATGGAPTGRPLRVDATLATYMYRPAGAAAPGKPGAPAAKPAAGGAR